MQKKIWKENTPTHIQIEWNKKIDPSNIAVSYQ